MKHLPYMVIMMTSWLCMLGHCSDRKFEVKCTDDQKWEGQDLRVHCIIDFFESSISNPTSCIVTKCHVNGEVVKCNTTEPASKPNETKELILLIPKDLVKINQVATLTLETECDGQTKWEFNISKVICADVQAQVGHVVHANCTVDYTLINSSCHLRTEFNGTVVTSNTSTSKPKIEELIIGIPNVNIKQHEMTVNLTLHFYSDCDDPVKSTFTVNFINTGQSVGEGDGKEVGKEDNRHQGLWAIGGTGIVIVIVGLVLFKLKGHRTRSGSSSLRLWRRTPSADTDMESNNDSISRQDSDCEPLSGGQESRDPHTPPATSHTDDTSS